MDVTRNKQIGLPKCLSLWDDTPLSLMATGQNTLKSEKKVLVLLSKLIGDISGDICLSGSKLTSKNQ